MDNDFLIYYQLKSLSTIPLDQYKQNFKQKAYKDIIIIIIIRDKMTSIRPMSDLCKSFAKISERHHKDGEPVFMTTNAKGNLVVLSLATFEKQVALMELYQKLAVAERQAVEGAKTLSHEEVFSKLRKKIDGRRADEG